MNNALTKVAPEVLTLARPVAKLLLAARQVAQRIPELQEVFRLSKTEKWDAAQWAHVYRPRKRHTHSPSFCGQQKLRAMSEIATLEAEHGDAWTKAQLALETPVTLHFWGAAHV